MRSIRDPYKISNAFSKKINEWPCIHQGDELALDRFSIFLTQCQTAMLTLTLLTAMLTLTFLHFKTEGAKKQIKAQWQLEPSPPSVTSWISLRQKQELRPTQSSRKKCSIVWMVPLIDLTALVKAKAKALASLKRLALRITQQK